MSFTARVVTGNTISIILAIASTAILNPKGVLWGYFLIGAVLLAVMSTVLGVLNHNAFKPLAGIVVALEKAAGGDLSVRVVHVGSGLGAPVKTGGR